MIDNYEPYAQDLIDDFSIKENDPIIAISVDMLDTGIDVPEIVNLVFFKLVRSKTKFHQMMGRGTRLCKELFGPGQDKENFYVFDYCQNFEFFAENPEGIEGSSQESLSKKIFKQRLNLLLHLQKSSGTAGEGVQRLRGSLEDTLHGEVFANSVFEVGIDDLRGCRCAEDYPSARRDQSPGGGVIATKQARIAARTPINSA